MWTLERFFDGWREMDIHESSPVFRGASARIRTECRNYIPSQFFPSIPLGAMHDDVRCENLEKLTFSDASIDLHISQDVMEHVFDPAAAFGEIARTLRPGGAHVFTTPLVNKGSRSERRACMNPDGSVEHLHPPEYHGNPISGDGSLVTMHWGYDIADFIANATGLHTTLIYVDDLSHGIRAEFIEVLLTRKPRKGHHT